MFFAWISETRGLSDKEKFKQRIALYGKLLHAIKDRKIKSLQLIWAVNQITDPDNTSGMGYCHGYCEEWARFSLTQWGQNEIPLSQENWDKLIGEEDYDFRPQCLKLNSTIKVKQNFHPSGPLTRERGQAINNHNDFDEFVGQILRSSVEILRQEPHQNKQHHHMFIVSMGSFVSESLFLMNWHETRLVVTTEGYVEWFDPNVGWFRSQESNPDIDTLKEDLKTIMTILEYPGKYTLISIFKHIEVDIDHYHADKRDFCILL